ncbi:MULTISPECIES: hypothetical protein [unclassified Tenacibaculum]|uniref:hypothetical protein n=1 Tax=unclassified Tenacibaculum TaxID=2635139 RepID=UPI001F31C017|nr:MULTISPECIES: hypothetical protein [unclassified Tenacibaculum]MCF2876357.1 hypothetical protein [Tenacibaculum sp. Cn5-1]MCF2936500.1 hypothetical protein [Tenacibaculum sp. Cn5-34]MCG7512775.1 hypothetical protein [Tenacibaculum sp. Cn5-46]
MKVLKKITIVIVLMISTIGFGQSKLEKFKAIPAEEMAKKKTDLMKKKLSLSEEQTKEIFRINLDAFKARKKVVENSSMFSIRKKMKAVGKEEYLKLEEVLSEIQLKKYNSKVKKELKEAMSNWMEQWNKE